MSAATTTTLYPAWAVGKTHLMRANHAERILKARASKPEYVNPNGPDGEHDFDAYTAYLNSAAYKNYEREYRNALASARVLCIQRQTRVYHTPASAPISADTMPTDLCAKCATHLA